MPAQTILCEGEAEIAARPAMMGQSRPHPPYHQAQITPSGVAPSAIGSAKSGENIPSHAVQAYDQCTVGITVPAEMASRHTATLLSSTSCSCTGPTKHPPCRVKSRVQIVIDQGAFRAGSQPVPLRRYAPDQTIEAAAGGVGRWASTSFQLVEVAHFGRKT